jgi:uncharacterized protein (DUF362 family)
MSLSSDISRRDVLKALPFAAILASCGRSRPYRRQDFHVPSRSAVGLFAAPTYATDFADVIGRGLREFGVDVRQRSVFLKPNLVEYVPGTAVNTHPAVVAGAAVAFLRAGAREVVVGEGPGHRRDIEYLLSASGLGETLGGVRVRFVDLNHDDVRMVPTRSRFTRLEEVALPVALLAADFVVSMPKLKTHHWAGMTGAMKNLFGVVPGAIYGWPKNILHARGIEASILDLAAVVQPDFAIVDGVVAMEGDGPIMGKAREVGVIAMGPDPTAVDATCARLIGFDPAKMTYLKLASEYLGNIASSRIELRGERLDRYRTRFDVLETFRPLQAPESA